MLEGVFVVAMAETVAFPAPAMREENRGPRSLPDEGAAPIGTPAAVMAEIAAIMPLLEDAAALAWLVGAE
jgi:hypothetical protein